MTDPTPSDPDEALPVRSQIGPWALVPAWVILADIPPLALRVYAALALHANRTTGACWPSRRTIANEVRCSPDTVDRCLRELRGIGAIEVRPRVRDRVKQTNLYVVVQVDPATLNPQPEVEVEGVAAPTRLPGRTDADRVAAPVRHRTRASEPEPSSSSSSSDPRQNPPEGAEDDEARAAAAVEQIGVADHDAAMIRGQVRAPEQHRASCIVSARRRGWDAALAIAHDHPDWSPEQIVDQLLTPPEPPRKGTAAERAAEAQRDLMARNMARHEADRIAAEANPPDPTAVEQARRDARAALDATRPKGDDA